MSRINDINQLVLSLSEAYQKEYAYRLELTNNIRELERKVKALEEFFQLDYTTKEIISEYKFRNKNESRT